MHGIGMLSADHMAWANFRPRQEGVKRAVAIACAFFIALSAAAATNSAARAQPPLTKTQSQARDAYDKALDAFRAILRERRAQINAQEKLPNLPGQALYLARNKMMSTYKDVTDALPAKIGRTNKFAIPPAYFDADNEPLLDE